MRIALLGHGCRVAGGLSIGKNIIWGLPRIAPQHEYLATVPAGLGYEDLSLPNVAIKVIPSMGYARRIRFEWLELSDLVRAFQPDWVWGLANTGLVKPPCRQAILIQDSHLVYHKKHFGQISVGRRIKHHLLKRHLNRCLKQTDIVFCQTQAMRDRFSRLMPFSGRLALCPNAVSAFAGIPESPLVPEPLKPYGGRFRMLLLAKYYEHKNIERVVEAYERFGPELRETLCVLTILPSHARKASDLLNRIRRGNLEDRILNVGSLSQDQLAEYYLACDALLLPTLLESFSGTYLEAMHFGRPIATSDLDFAHGICGDAAEYFDPWDSRAIKDAIVKLRDDSGLRTELVCRGKNRLEKLFHSWPDILRNVADELGIAHD